jgi:hypothetical protein
MFGRMSETHHIAGGKGSYEEVVGVRGDLGLITTPCKEG